MTWSISQGPNPSIMNVEVTYTVTVDSINPGSGYTRDAQGIIYEGRINGTTLTLVLVTHTIGVFSFTPTSIVGTWNDGWCYSFCQRLYTPANGLTLVK